MHCFSESQSGIFAGDGVEITSTRGMGCQHRYSIGYCGRGLASASVDSQEKAIVASF